MYSISAVGSSSIFGMSRKDDRVFTPLLLAGSDFTIDGETGSGGGGLKGGSESAIDFFGFKGTEPAASRLTDSILYLYASLNEVISLIPSLF
jgi:hypothetical protein